ncbi:Gfo/Idh/MocA family protein [Paenibacillus daejeonensis]|uniref:Gfo/Idh/MocA family protein n=1 Tax=Paenibacillus daejeonensis TaxID=135193 RepID=UPI00035F60FE|nr:Gfo/Idh/MocA family oxidoreductase [Paenibacillus daejeonensis]
MPKIEEGGGGIVRFGVIGAGLIADFHLRALQAIPGAVVVAVSSRRESRAREVGEREGCPWTTDYGELLARPDLDAVCVTTSSGSHYEIGMAVLRAGKHLIMEKPLAMTGAQCEGLVEEARSRMLLLSTISQRRFEPQHQAIQEVIAAGKLGRLLLAEAECPYYRDQAYYDSADWRGTIAEDGGALMNQGIHSVDLLLWLVGSPVHRVYGCVSTMTHQMEAEDIGLAFLQFRSGTLGRIMVSTSIVPGFVPKLALYGEYGTIVVEGSTITHWSVPDMEKPVAKKPDGTGGGVSDPGAISWEPHRLQLMGIVDAIREGRPAAVTGEDGWRAVALIEAIVRSSDEAAEVGVDGEGS